MPSATVRPDTVVKARTRWRRGRRRRARTDRTAWGTDRATPPSAARRPAPLATGSPLASSTGKRAAVAFHAHPVDAQHVRPIGEEGDAAEPFGLALRAQVATRLSYSPISWVLRGGRDLTLRFRRHGLSPGSAITSWSPSKSPVVDRDPVDRSPLIGVSPPAPSSRSGSRREPLRATVSVAQTRVAAGSSAKSSSTVGTSHSGGR